MKPLDPRLAKRPAVRWHLGTSIVIGGLSAAALIAQAAGLAGAIATSFESELEPRWVALAVAGIALRGLIAWADVALGQRAASRVKAELREELLDDLVDPRRIGPRPSSTSVATLLGQGLDTLDSYVGRYLRQIVLAVIVPGVVVVAAVVADPLSGAIIALTVPLVIGFLILIGLRTQDELGRRWSALDRLGRHFADVLDGLVLLTGFGRSQVRGLRETGERHRRATLDALKLAFTSALALDLFATLSVALVAVEVGLRIVHGDLTLATGLFVLFLAPEAFTPIRRLGAHFHDGTAGVEAVDAVFDVLDHPTHPGVLPAPDVENLTLTIDQVEVRHPSRTRPALRSADLTIEPGVVTALVGRSGSGKSTLLDVLLGFQLPTSGKVWIGEEDLTTIDPASWRRRVAWVPQLPTLVDGTVADNVRLGLSATDRDVQRALALAGAADLDLERRLHEGRGNVSAGEKRRIAVARALLRVQVGDARLVLMDEPTAGLDADREAAVLDSLRSSGATVVVASHRAATTEAADRILHLEGALVR